MPRTGAALWIAVSVSIAALGCGQPQWNSGTSINKPRKHVMVQFTDSSLHPSTAQVLQGGQVVWINYATLYVGAVVFPESIRQSFTCSELRPLFAKVAAGYQSEVIRPDTENVTLPCPLKPGEYSYELQLFSAAGPMGAAEGLDDPELTIPGKIVVK